MSLEATLAEHERTWRERPLLRRVYRDWYEQIARELAPGPGATVELGSGIAQLKEIVPGLVATDVEPTRWADEVVDARALPYADGSLANIVLLDVFHHLADPAAFLDEARRTLRPGGRVVLLEPYCSPLSTPLYRRFHEERTELGVDPFVPDARQDEEAMAGNQALPTLAFFRRADELARRWPELRPVRRRRLSFVLYPLTGGYSRRPLVPARLHRPLRALERLLAPLAPLAAFRCLVVLERAGPETAGGNVRSRP